MLHIQYVIVYPNVVYMLICFNIERFLCPPKNLYKDCDCHFCVLPQHDSTARGFGAKVMSGLTGSSQPYQEKKNAKFISKISQRKGADFLD